MMFLATLLLAFTLPFAPTDAKRAESLHRAMHLISEVDAQGDRASCSAYAIGKHALLTAEHCDMQATTVSIDEKVDAKIEAKIVDGEDHLILLVSGAEFEDLADVCICKLEQEDKVFTWGNPSGLKDQYREGYVMGRYNYFDEQGQHNAYIFDLVIRPGDSGAAVFNERGQLVTVIRFLYGPFAGANPIKFKNDELKRARNF